MSDNILEFKRPVKKTGEPVKRPAAAPPAPVGEDSKYALHSAFICASTCALLGDIQNCERILDAIRQDGYGEWVFIPADLDGLLDTLDLSLGQFGPVE